MDELELLKGRVETLEALVKSLLSGDERVIHLTNTPIANLVLGKGCQVTMHSCPTGMAFYGDQDSVEAAEARLQELTDQAEELEGMIDGLADHLDDIRNELDRRG